MSDDHEHTTCRRCGDEVRVDRVNDDGVCVNCLALSRTPASAAKRRR
jgi:hypothetical protein